MCTQMYLLEYRHDDTHAGVWFDTSSARTLWICEAPTSGLAARALAALVSRLSTHAQEVVVPDLSDL